MNNFNLTKKTKILLAIGIILFLVVISFFGVNSMHKSVVVGESEAKADTSVMINDTHSVPNTSATPQKNKPLFVSKNDEKKTKESLLMILVLLTLGIIVYAIAAKENRKQEEKKHHLDEHHSS